MVQRRLLTSEFVNSVTAPEIGESWIADLQLKGFGLRLWRTKSGSKKAFAIRTSNRKGKVFRRTFPIWNYRHIWLFKIRNQQIPMGELLDDARNWARDEIDQVKGRLTVAQEESVRRSHGDKRISNITLERAAEVLVMGMRKRGLSTSYVDRLDKLFSANISPKLKRKKLKSISGKALAELARFV